MRYLVLGIVLLSATAAAFGQGHGPYWSLGGFGNVLYPGTGHAPATPPGGVAGSGHTAAPIAGRNIFPNPIPARHPQHSRTVIVPYPVFYGGGYAGNPAYDAPPAYGDQGAPAENDAPPPVVINQGYVPPQANPTVREYVPDQPQEQPSGMRMYEAPTPGAGREPRRRTASDDPTVYLIVFRDHSIIQALGYWMEGGALHYVSLEHTLNQVSFDLIDREASQRLNDERGVEFKLPR
ncbi:MAG TPA: hypothetical protein VGV35_15820 [Bryobacteraceae bacterium]|nr:hypothetical protein [Bryobacteraceae bacterium]